MGVSSACTNIDQIPATTDPAKDFLQECSNFDLQRASKIIYTDGDPRPVFRGILHTLVAALLPIVFAVIVLGYPGDWPLGVFIIGKECSYLSSALFHRWAGVSNSFPLHIFFRQVDRFSICISIAASAVPTSFRTSVLFYSISGGLLLGAVITNFSDMQLSGGEGQVRRKLFRVVMLSQFIFTIVFIGWSSTAQWSWFWIVGSSAYIVGFIFFGVGLVLKNKTLAAASIRHVEAFPWHKHEQNGLHEDFHTCIFIGDVLYFLNAIYYGNYIGS